MSFENRYENYNSHKWTSTKAGGSPSEPDEWVTYCLVCGIEDLGDPDEFDIDYPACDDSVEPVEL